MANQKQNSEYVAKRNKTVVIIHSFSLSSVGNENYILPKIKRLENAYNVKEILIPPGIIGILRSLPKIYGTETRTAQFVHVEWGSLLGFACSFLGLKKYITLRGSDWYRLTKGGSYKDRVKSWISTRLTRISLNRYTGVFCVSKKMGLDVFNELGIVADVFTTPVDTSKIFKMTKQKASLNLDLDPAKKRILFLSAQNDNPIKRQWLAIKAFEIAKNYDPNIDLLMIHGKRKEEVNYYINACDVLLLTSEYEGWPNVVKEALICGVPFVSTDVSDLREIAEVEPSCQVCEPNPEQLAKAIIATINSTVAIPYDRYETLWCYDKCMEKLLVHYKD